MLKKFVLAVFDAESYSEVFTSVCIVLGVAVVACGLLVLQVGMCAGGHC